MNSALHVNGQHSSTHHLCWVAWVKGGFNRGTLAPVVFPFQEIVSATVAPHPESNQFSFPSYVFGRFLTTVPSLELRDNDFVSASWCMGPLKRISRSLVALCLSQEQSLLVFEARCYGDSSSCQWHPGLGSRCGAGDPSVG